MNKRERELWSEAWEKYKEDIISREPFDHNNPNDSDLYPFMKGFESGIRINNENGLWGIINRTFEQRIHQIILEKNLHAGDPAPIELVELNRVWTEISRKSIEENPIPEDFLKHKG